MPYDKESVLIGRKGTIDKPRYINKPFWTVDTLFYSKISSSVSAKYIYYFFCTIDWYIYNEASGVPSLSSRTIEGIKLHLPPLPEQQAIANILTIADREIELLQQELQQEKQKKKALMQLLLTGIVRVTL